MSDNAEPQKSKRGKKLKMLLMPLAVILLGGAGFGTAYLGYLPAFPNRAGAKAAMPEVVFVDIPTVELPIPGSRHRVLIVSAAIETDVAHKKEVEHLMPRVQDAFTSFLSDVDAKAYDKRGILEILRSELVTRTRFVLGEEPVKDLLITEFRVK